MADILALHTAVSLRKQQYQLHLQKVASQQTAPMSLRDAVPKLTEAPPQALHAQLPDGRVTTQPQDIADAPRAAWQALLLTAQQGLSDY